MEKVTNGPQKWGWETEVGIPESGDDDQGRIFRVKHKRGQIVSDRLCCRTNCRNLSGPGGRSPDPRLTTSRGWEGRVERRSSYGWTRGDTDYCSRFWTTYDTPVFSQRRKTVGTPSTSSGPRATTGTSPFW